MLQPHLAKGRKVSPEKILHFPWDHEARKTDNDAPKLSADQQRKRMEDLVAKLGDELI